MNITSISPFNLSQFNNFKGKVIQFPSPENNPNIQQSPANPSYFKAMYGIEAPKLAIKTMLPNKTSYDVYLDEEAIANHLVDKKGELRPAAVKMFTYFQAQIAGRIMEEREYTGKDIPEAATDRTIDLFRLSKWKGGYDFTDFDKNK